MLTLILNQVAWLRADTNEAFQFFQEEASVVAVAAKQPESVLNASGTVYVITEDDIKKYGWHNMREILETIPNMDPLWQWNWLTGGQRGFTGDINGTLLLIDGREVNDQLAGEAFTTDGTFPAARIKRVEVLMGPNSTLYGANAMQGVINVITKAGDETEAHPKDLTESYVEYSGYQSYGAGFNYRKTTDKGTIGLDAYRSNINYNYPELIAFANNDAQYSRQPSIDQVRCHDANCFHIYEKAWTLDLHMRFGEVYMGVNYFGYENNQGLESQQLDYGADWIQRQTTLAYIGDNHKFTDNLELKSEFQYFYEDVPGGSPAIGGSVNGVAISSAPPTSYNNLLILTQGAEDIVYRPRVTEQLEYQSDSREHWTFGFEWQQYRFQSYSQSGQYNAIVPVQTTDGVPTLTAAGVTKWNRYSPFIQDALTIVPDQLKLTMGARYNKQDFTEDAWLPRASLVYNPRPSSALKFTYGQGFRAADVFEETNGGVLPPQKMTMYEINYSQELSHADLRLQNIAALSYMRATNFFTLTNTTDPITGKVINTTIVSGAETVRSAEDMLRASYNKLSGFVGYRFAVPDETDVSGQKARLNTPQNKEKIGLSYQFHPLFLASLFVDHWDRSRFQANTIDGTSTEIITVPDWTIYRANFRFGDFTIQGTKTSFSLYVDNLFNTPYYEGNSRSITPIQYLQGPRTWRLSADVKF